MFDEFPEPFDREGEPARYLRLILPFLETERARRADMLKWMGVDINQKRTACANILAKLTKAQILYTKPRGDGYWKRGERFNEFIGYLAQCMVENKNLNTKFKNLLYKGSTPSIDFILKD